MSDTTLPPEPPPFDPSLLDAEPADMPVPDHTANPDAPEPVNPDASEPAPDNVRPFARPRGGDKHDRPKRKTEVPPKRKGQLVAPLTNLYTSVGVAVMAFDSVCGTVIVENASTCAESLDALAQRNEAIRRALYAMLETSAWGGVLTAHLPLLVMVLMHHGPRDIRDRIAPIAAFVAPSGVEAMAAEQPYVAGERA